MNRTKILGTGSFLPKKIVTNDDLAKNLDTSDEWIVSRTGIRERRVVSDGETCSDLAYHASLQALKAAGKTAQDLDMIIVATLTPEQRVPATSCMLQEKLKATKACVYDINVSCSGFVYALSVADQYIKTGEKKTILVVGAEVMTSVIDPQDRSTTILFGDGAGAAVLVPTDKDEHVLLSTHLFSNGSLHGLLEVPKGGSNAPWTPELLERKEHLVKMKGKEVFKEAVKSMSEASEIALKKAGFTMDDVALFIPHQANMRIINAIARRLHCPEEKIFVNLDKYGNTSSASIPVALDEVVRQGLIKSGDLMLIATFGAGFAWGSALVRW